LLNIHEDEITLFLWTSLLLFLIRSSNLIFNNFAETAFLKRFGVEHLPVIYAANSVVTFTLMGLLTGFLVRLPGSRLLTYALVFCAASVGALRFVIPLELEALYPLLYVLKTQYEVLLAFLFSNLANDLFDTRQSKRIFPLITAGGITGAVLGSFGTPLLAKAIPINDLLFAYAGVALAGAATVHKLGTLFPAALLATEPAAKGKSSVSITTEIKKALPVIRESALVKALVFLTLLPNIVIPIINYQFSYVVNQTYATEGGMIGFYGYFRGVQNSIALIVALFVGRIYGRFGIPVALMFHPFNYVIASMAYLLKFNIFSAIYATLSTGVLRNTVNGPARSVLYGLLPIAQRAVIRPFLRGTVVRVGILAGSGIVYASGYVMSPRYLSAVALVFIAAWIGSTFYLKRRYASILLGLIKGDRVDLDSLEHADAREIFKEKKVRSHLFEAFASARGDLAVWYAQLLRSLGAENLDAHILAKIREEDDATRLALLPQLSDGAGEQAVKVFLELIDPQKPELMVAFARTGRRVYADAPLELQQEVFDMATIPEVKACAIVGLCHRAPDQYQPIIDSWLDSDLLPERRAGAVAAGESDARRYIQKLERLLETETDESIVPLILQALHRLGAPGMNDLAFPYVTHPAERVRLGALTTFELASDDAVRAVIRLMGDPADAVRDLAMEKLHSSQLPIGRMLGESLGIHSRRVRDGIFHLAESLNVTDVQMLEFYRDQLEKGYAHVAEIEALGRLPQSQEGQLLADHLDQERMLRVENVLRTLSARDSSGMMRTIRRGVSSADSRRQANALEALDTALDRALSLVLMPMLENVDSAERLAVGKRNFALHELDSNPAVLYSRLLSTPDNVTVLLTLHLVAKQGIDGLDRSILDRCAQSDDHRVRQLAHQVLDEAQEPGSNKEGALETSLSVPDRIVSLRGVEIFEDLSVSQLAAVASATEEVSFPPGETLHNPGDPVDKLYLVVRGEVSVTQQKQGGSGPVEELTRFGPGQAFGIAALFEDEPFLTSAQATEETELLCLGRDDFEEIVKEHPEIALRMCRYLSKHLHTAVDRLSKR
jgi:ATP/ADP translocase